MPLRDYLDSYFGAIIIVTPTPINTLATDILKQGNGF